MRLKRFYLSNYRSYNKGQTIEFGDDEKNVTTIYGPNSAGKTNLFRAANLFRNFIRTSTSFNGQLSLFEPFRLNQSSIDKPIVLEAEVEYKSKVYLYHFEIQNGKVVQEYLKQSMDDGKTFDTVFRRASMSKKERFGSFDNELLKRTRDDALVITKAWEDNNKIAKDIFDWLDHFQPVNVKFAPYKIMTASRIENDPEFKMRVLELLQVANLFIQDVRVSRAPLSEELFKQLPFTDDIKRGLNKYGYLISTTHLLRNDAGSVVGTTSFSMENNESAGTNRIFELASPILDTLEKGGILYLDEFENDLHPMECSFLVSLFDSRVNTKNAQLIINTHSTILQNQVGRDNIRFISKNPFEESVISRVSGIKATDNAIERKYLKGLLGATPKIQGMY